MDATRFDGLARGMSVRLTRRTGIGLLAGSSFPLLGLVATTEAKKKKKVTLCLNGQTITKSKKQAKKLTQQGATAGACVGKTPPAADCLSGERACGSTCIPAGNCCVDDDCEGSDSCKNGSCVTPRCGTGGSCRVFVTSATFKGTEIGGLAGGDVLCQTAAGGLGGTYKAWLSAEGVGPLTRFANTNRTGPYRLVGNNDDGGNPAPIVAVNFTDLITCDETGGECLLAGIDRNNSGELVLGSERTWTGIIFDGTPAALDCNGWGPSGPETAGAAGTPGKTNSQWTAIVAAECATRNRLYCFEQAV